MHDRKAIAEVALIQQGRYLEKSLISDAISDELAVPIWGARGIIGYTSKPMYASSVPLVTCRGNGCGLVQWTGGAASISNNAMAIVPREDGDSDRRFLFYSLAAENFGDVTTGSAQPQITRASLSGKLIYWPGSREQRAQIATLLSAIDDKVDQTRRTNRALEDLARATYRAWFVDFEPVKAKAAGLTNFAGMPPAAFAALPGHFEASPMGPIPQGWDIGTLGDVLRERGERMNVGEETQQLPYVPIDCITAKRVTLETFKSGEEAQSSLIRFRSGDILFGAMRPYFHKVCLAPFVGTTRATCFVLTPRAEHDTAFALMLASEEATVQFATSNSVGSTIPYAKWQNSLSKMPCVLPPEELRANYQAVVKPMLQLANQGVSESNKLVALRDYLLPRVLEGRVRVSTVDVFGPETR